MKKLLSLMPTLLLISVVLSLAACGGGEEQEAPAQAEVSGAEQASEQAADETTAESADAGDPAAGEKLFASTCTACHGPAGEGVEGLGSDLTTSQFVAGQTDAELVQFIIQGRDPSDPTNTTGIAMPPKGGNPALSDEDLLHIVSYLRTIHE